MHPCIMSGQMPPPIVLYTGDSELEMLGRTEENAYMMRMLKVAGHQKVKHYFFLRIWDLIKKTPLTITI